MAINEMSCDEIEKRLELKKLGKAVHQQIYKGRQIVVFEEGRVFSGDVDGKRVITGKPSREGVLQACREEIDEAGGREARLDGEEIDRRVMKRLARDS